MLIGWISSFNGGGNLTYQVRSRLPKDDLSFYQDVERGDEYLHLKNLRAATDYVISVRSNNSHFVSSWSEESIFRTLPHRTISLSSLIELTKTVNSTKILWLIIVFPLVFVLLNLLIVLIVIGKRRQRKRKNTTDNSSTTTTNETETNTIDVFQSATNNFLVDRRFLPNINPYRFENYQNFDEEESQQPFVSSRSSISFQPTFSTDDKTSLNELRSASNYATIRVKEKRIDFFNLFCFSFVFLSASTKRRTFDEPRSKTNHL